MGAEQAAAGPVGAGVKVRRVRRRGRLAIAKRCTGPKGMQVRPKRWLVERMRGWGKRHRRLSQADAR